MKKTQANQGKIGFNCFARNILGQLWKLVFYGKNTSWTLQQFRDVLDNRRDASDTEENWAVRPIKLTANAKFESSGSLKRVQWGVVSGSCLIDDMLLGKTDRLFIHHIGHRGSCKKSRH